MSINIRLLGKKKKLHSSRLKEYVMLLLPVFIMITLFSIYPLLRGIYIGFTNYRFGYNTITSFNGLENYLRLIKDRYFLESVWVITRYSISNVFFQYIFGFFVAILLNCEIKFKGIFRGLILVPWVMPAIIRGLMWRFFYNPDYGLINYLLTTLGVIDSPVNWLGNYTLALPAAIFVRVWSGTPFMAITLLAGLQTIDPCLYEAAEIDGARGFQKLWCITLPQLKSISVVIVALVFIWTINEFDLIYVLTSGGPGYSTTVPMYLAYNEAFQFGRVGYSAAIGNSMLIIVIFMISIFLKQSSKKSG